MAAMSSTVTWTDVAIRLALTVIAGILIGYNRSEYGKAAGIRTMLLVCLAAAVAMLQVNLLLPMVGRKPDSFVTNDLMRLPLGILTGVGFIGGGVILRRGSVAVGVTTAATLWLVTVIGLCFGGGQLALGVIATAAGLFALWVLAWIERDLPHEYPASLDIELDPAGPSAAAIDELVRAAGLVIAGRRTSHSAADGRRQLSFELRQTRRSRDTDPPAFVGELTRLAGVRWLQWRTQG